MAERRKPRTARTADRRARESRRAADEAPEDEQYDDEQYDGEESGERRRGGRRSTGSTKLSAADAAAAGQRQLAELTGKETSAVVSVEPAEDGWLVGVEVVEDRRVPSTSDLMALYEVAIDSDGDVASYRRTKRYARGRGNGNGNGAT